MEVLKTSLFKSLSSQGSTLFLAGEAGVGKTRLTLDLEKVAKTSGATVMRGQCLAESLSPLLPIKDALRSASLDYVISGAKPPQVLWMYLVRNQGLLISEYGRDDESFDNILKVLK